ncbi:MAG: RdgB/HAM1 family non-canonical purine NTP pyrophosphatase [Oscillospiraceae bacterium]|nr:RdgB/HAM1 family non-canonical purine NTP pyrophosphatase [Oscillospiraceae bacterium]
MKLVIATGNEGKVREFKRILEPMGFEVSSLKEMGLVLDVEETGETFLENARTKAEAACRLTGLAAIADDSGLCVDALDGAPGVYSARYSGEGDDGNNQKLLRELRDVPPPKRTGRYACAICCTFPDGEELTAEGTCEGIIGYELSGSRGFGYDPLFYVGERSFGQYGDEEKDAISHRGKALRLFCDKLKEYQAQNA